MVDEDRTAARKANAKYETKRGKVIMRVQLSLSDDNKEWERIRNDLVQRYGSAKQGIYEIYKIAKEKGEFS